MKFNKKLEEDFRRQPSIRRMMDVLKDRESAIQIALNNTPVDHRYYQGLLKDTQDLLNLFTEASDKR